MKNLQWKMITQKTWKEINEANKNFVDSISIDIYYSCFCKKRNLLSRNTFAYFDGM